MGKRSTLGKVFTVFLVLSILISGEAFALGLFRTGDRQSPAKHPISDSSKVSPNLFNLRLDSLTATVPLNYNSFVQHYIDIYTSRKSQIGKMLGLSKYYFPIFERALISAGIPPEIKYITIVESALDPHAVSRSGAVGPWQFMFATAKGYGLKMDNYVDERRDPVRASAAAAHYLSDAYRQIGDWLLTIAAFNCGTGAVLRAIERSGGVADFWLVRPFLPKETQNYVPAFIATMYVMNYHKDHGIEESDAGFNIYTDVIDVTRRLPISSIAKAADLDLKELLYLNPSYKKQIINGSESSPMSLVVPELSRQSYAALYEVLNGNGPAPKTVLASHSTPESTDVSASSKRPAQQIYRVKPGQTLSHIANLHGVEVQDLKVWNNLRSFTIVPGQPLKVSAPAGSSKGVKAPEYITYIVKAGDTLSEIAARFKGASVSSIKASNGLSRSTLQPGMTLKINKG